MSPFEFFISWWIVSRLLVMFLAYGRGVPHEAEDVMLGGHFIVLVVDLCILLVITSYGVSMGTGI